MSASASSVNVVCASATLSSSARTKSQSASIRNSALFERRAHAPHGFRKLMENKLIGNAEYAIPSATQFFIPARISARARGVIAAINLDTSTTNRA